MVRTGLWASKVWKKNNKSFSKWRASEGQWKWIVNFWDFSDEALKRDGELKSISLRLRDIEPFKDNVRIHYDQERLDILKKSIKDNWDIWNIDVFHIIEWDRYVIADGHRTHKAYTELYGLDKKVEVFVRWTYDKFTKDVEVGLMKVGFITSNTKENLDVYEELVSLKKYLSKLDSVYLEKAPHKVSQQNVYEQLWLSKSKAMDLNKILNTYSWEQIEKFKNLSVPYKVLVQLSRIKKEEDLEDAMELIDSGYIGSTTDIKNFQEAKNEIAEDDSNNWEEVTKEEKIEKVKEKMDDQKEAKIKDREEMIAVKKVKSATNNINKILMNLNTDSLNEEERKVLTDSIDLLNKVLKNKEI